MMDEMLELKQEFLSEAFELLASMEEEVLVLEKNTESLDSVNAIFRVAHTLKGGAASLELERIAVFTHNLENLLDLVRASKLSVDGEIIDIVLSSLDILTALVKAASQSIEAAPGIELDTLDSIKSKIGESSGSAGIQSSVVQAKPVETPLPASNTKIQVDNTMDDEAANFKDILIDEFSISKPEKQQIQQGLQEGSHLFLIHVHLDDTNEMKSVSGIQTITAVRGIGALVSAAPSIPEVMETEFIEHLQFLILSKEGQDRIFAKIYLSDVTKEVEISDISNLFGQVMEEFVSIKEVPADEFSNPLDQIPEQDFNIFSEEIHSALQAEYFVYNVRILIAEDALMRSVDSLLVITSLEEIGEIINTIPSKRDLQADTYFPVIDILFYTKSDKDMVKEKAFINGSTIEIRVSEFKIKDGNLSLPESVQKQPTIPMQQPNNTRVPEPTGVKEDITPPVVKPVELPVSTNPTESVLPVNTNLATEKTKDSTPVEVLKDSDILMSRFTSKEEARIRGIRTTDVVVAAKTFLKVESTRVDSLLNLVSELVISKAALTQISTTYISEVSELKLSISDVQDLLMDIAVKNPNVDRDSLRKINQYLLSVIGSWRGTDVFESTVNSISRSINELQEGITKIRMVPIGNVFNRFPRMIRDISKQLGKKIRLDIFGEDTELDKSIIEELADPLMHMIRNSADHGVERPDVRLAKGKKEEGVITLKAVHEGTMIRIEIQDDGAGLDPQRIFKKAVEKGLISGSQTLSTEDINQLILLPGFSTAEQVTDLSGRGVGMDVVRRNIEELSGKLSIESEFGKGSKFIIKIPLTLSIIQALVFQVKGYFYAIPLSVIAETIPLKKDETHLFEKSEVTTINGNLISIIDIGKIFNLKESRADRVSASMSKGSGEFVSTELLDESLKILDRIKFRDNNYIEEDYFSIENIKKDEQAETEEDIHKYLIVVQTGNKRVGLLVDSIISEQDIVIKPLDKRYATSQGLSGATVLGDGSISLIIDVIQLVELYLNKDSIVTL